ncbi:hypothetical protein TWF192_003683 [Orbilia oligospora]|uniref:Uncharacterized protein n=1 Tax=Orbilia oligospora TaxID=2813651 RepID=A0A6G1LS38_ORBOL|nr:hypothetical protein TWF191_009691 [Orbilia oligospora]KAF3231192.1 hypothetical protein TWF192_003683 [Orbilia oligospora]
MFAPSYNPHADPSKCQGPYDLSDDATRLAGWRYGSMTPPEAPSRWYNLIIPESARRIILGSTEWVEDVEDVQPNNDGELTKEEKEKEDDDDEEEEEKEKEKKKKKKKEETPPWRYGSMTPPNRWYDRFVPKSIKRTHISKNLGANKSEEMEAQTESEREAEIERREFLKKEYGDVDCGHCSASEEWTERGTCMCTLTWRLPGRFPRSFCETICNGIVVRTGMEAPPVESPLVESPKEEERSPGPCWEVKPDPSEPETRLCWVKQYNPRSQRYEYVAKPWRPPEEDDEDEAHDYCHETLGQNGMYRYENRPEHEYVPGSSTPRGAREEEVQSPFSCGRKPPWLQHVHRFVRVEELDSPLPPASQFISKNGTILGKFSEGYFKIPYYDPEGRKFRYAEPRTIDMRNLKLDFRSTAPPPKPVVPRRPKMLPERPLVMAQKKEPVQIRVPKYDPTPRYEPPPIRISVKPKPKPKPKSTPKPRIENPYHSPRFVVFPPSSKNRQDDTPCPPPRKPKVTLNDDDKEYQPTGGEESEEREVESSSHPPVPKKTVKKKRRNSDPTYKQHGVRENNKIEKSDLQQMKNEEVVSGGQSKEKPLAPRPVKPKPDFKPKPILKNGKGENTEPILSKNKCHNVGEVPSKVSRSKGKTGGSQRNDLSHLKAPAPKEKANKDGECIPVRDREEERRERFDILDMKKRVDKEAEKETRSEGGSDSEQSDKKGESLNPVKPQKKTVRKRKAPEDRAYRPGRRV